MSVLPLPDELLLLAYNADKGRPVVERNCLDHGLAGGVLFELVLAGRVDVDAGRLAVLAADPMGDPLFDAALQRIAANPAAHGPPGWISRLRRGMRDEVLARLVERGVLRRVESRLLGFIRGPSYPANNPQPETDIRDRLVAVVREHQSAEPRTAALISLVLASRMDKKLFTDASHDAVRARMDEVTEGDWVGPAVRRAIDAVDQALWASSGRLPPRR